MRFSGWSITPVTYSTVLDLHPTAATLSMDESWTPYLRATLVCPIPQDDILDRIDPRVPSRVNVRIARASAASFTLADLPDLLPAVTLADLDAIFAGPPTWRLLDVSRVVGDPYESPPRVDLDASRRFDLQLRERSVDWVRGTMTLELASDELVLQDYARMESTSDTYTPPATTSLVALVSWGLGLLGWSLAADSVNATIDSSTVVWNLGESLWDFLDAHVRAADRRLWCDEARVWHLTMPLTGAAGDPVTIDRPASLVDTISRSPAAGYAESVVVIYEWTDAAGAQRRADGYANWNSAEPVTLVQRWTNTRGTTPKAFDAAAALRRRAATRGRAVTVEAVADPAATPGVALTVSGVPAPVREAMVSAVTWSYPDDVMTIRTRDAATT